MNTALEFAYTVIFVEDVLQTVEFYEKAFDLQRALVTPNFAQMQTGAVTLAFGANANERHELPADFSFRENHPDQEPGGFQISFVCQDVAAAFKQAINAGAIPVVPPRTMPWGQTVSRVRDCNGVLVSLVSRFQPSPMQA
jgi:uncharacterized glyoxalase superfamily protein PhnB